MKQILRLKHWQLFMMLVGPGIVAMIIHMYKIFSMIANIEQSSSFNPNFATDMFSHMPIMMGLIFISYLVAILWQWSIGNLMYEKLPNLVSMNRGLFKAAVIVKALFFIFFAGNMVYMFSVFGDLAASSGPPEPPMGLFAGMAIMFPLQLLTMAATFYIYYYCGKSIKCVEEQRDLSFSDYVGEFFLVWFSFIGVWVLQPRLNKLVDKSQEEIEEGTATTFDSLIDRQR